MNENFCDATKGLRDTGASRNGFTVKARGTVTGDNHQKQAARRRWRAWQENRNVARCPHTPFISSGRRRGGGRWDPSHRAGLAPPRAEPGGLGAAESPARCPPHPAGRSHRPVASARLRRAGRGRSLPHQSLDENAPVVSAGWAHGRAGTHPQ